MSAVRLALLAVLVASGCDGAGGGYRVGGSVASGGMAVGGAEVGIDGVLNWQTVTDDYGEFEIAGVASGRHTLAVRSETATGSFSERTVEFELSADTELDEVLLPEPTTLEEPTSLASGTIMRLQWDASDDADFSEYRVYVHEDAGLDETTGTLLFSTTDREVTSFDHDPVDPGVTYFYRVFVASADGRLGGSNLASATAPLVDLVRDGGFEGADALDQWAPPRGDAPPPVLVDDVVHGGEQAVFLPSVETEPCCTGLGYLVPEYSIRLVEGVTYELSAWMKADGTVLETSGPEIWFVRGDWGLALFRSSDSFLPGDPPLVFDWKKDSKRFVAPETGFYDLTVAGTVTQVWVDDLSLMPQAPD